MKRFTIALGLTLLASQTLQAAQESADASAVAGKPRLMMQVGHGEGIAAMQSISPNGRLVATSDGTTIKIWAADVGRLVCDLKPDLPPKPSGNGQRKAGDGEGNGMLSSGSAAWSTDGLSLFVPSGDRTLVRYDLNRCRKAETIAVDLPDPRPQRQVGDPVQVDNGIEEVSTLQDGQILVRTPSGLYSTQITGTSARNRLIAYLQTPEPTLPELNASNLADLFSAEGKERLFGQLMDSMLSYGIGAHSANGQVTVLTGRAISMGPMVFPMSSAEPMVISAGQMRPLTSFQGAAASYKGVSVVAVSTSGRWLAVRSSASTGNNTLISLFDIPARKLMQQIVLTSEGAMQLPDSPIKTRMQPIYNQNFAAAGLSFSPDEKRLALLRPRPDGGAGMMDNPTIEIRSMADLKLVERKVPLRGTVIPETDLLSSMASMGGNSVAPSADQSGFVFQNSSLTRGVTMVAVQWKPDGLPALSSWSGTEGFVADLNFLDDRQLASVQVLNRLTVETPASAPTKPSKTFTPEMGLDMFRKTRVVTRWSFEDGNASRMHAGQIIAPHPFGVVDPAKGWMLTQELRALSLEQLASDLVMQRMSDGQAVWRRDFTDSQGRQRQIETMVVSPDRQLIAIVMKPQERPPASSAASERPSAPAPVPTRPEGEPSGKGGGLLGSLLGGKDALMDKVKGLLPSRVLDSVSQGANGAAASGRQLLLLEFSSGQTLATLDLASTSGDSDRLMVLSGKRLLLGETLIEWQVQGNRYSLSARRGKAFNGGELIGLTPDSARPILSGGKADSDLRALVLPASLAGAKLAVSSPDDRLIAVATSDRLSVHDSTRQMQPLIEADLEGLQVTAMALSPSGRHLAVGTSQGTIRLFDLARKRMAATLTNASDGSWTVIDPDGRLDSSNLGSNPALHWVMDDDPLNPLPFDTVMRAYHTPGLLSLVTLTEGETLEAVSQLGSQNRMTPLVSIEAVEPMAGKPGLVQVKVGVTPRTSARGQSSGMQDLRLFRNGRLVGYAPEQDGALEIDSRTGRYSRVFSSIRLPEGNRTVQFSAYAFNTDGLRGPSTAFDYKPPKAIAQQTGRAYVLTIGVNAYAGQAFSTLSFAANDARAVASEVSKHLKLSKGFSDIVTVTLESTAGGRDEATKARIQAALGVMAGRPDSTRVLAGIAGADRLAAATPADLVVIAFAGHGYVSSRTHDLHLVPSDVEAAAGVEGLQRFDARAISTAELDRWLRDVDAGQMSLIIDACHSAAAVASDFKAGPMGSRGLGQLASDKGARILVATQAADTALEHGSLQHGFLSYALIREGLAGGQADLRPKDGRVDMAEWLSYPVDRVPMLQAELRQGRAQIAVDNQLPRGVARPAGSVPIQAPRLQKPRLFDFIPPGSNTTVMRTLQQP